MQLLHKIHCPNCGSKAERHYITDRQLTRTQCSHCDYLMINCTRTGRVVEAYAPGIYARR
ncbi:MAG: replication restart DNA helicase PriA [Sphaerospermopsis sp. SIO1G2]|nr:replication restart DNA helicase PriA [Sphaerospermopsis sp. SIO1G1]NET70644.1 replication restart DNA helicase PriA [Sphaerospermopsis sp. SIO1G2]